jgi:hypothetical protein
MFARFQLAVYATLFKNLTLSVKNNINKNNNKIIFKKIPFIARKFVRHLFSPR